MLLRVFFIKGPIKKESGQMISPEMNLYTIMTKNWIFNISTVVCKLLICILVAVGSTFATRQRDTVLYAGHTITLGEVLDEALRNNISIKRSDYTQQLETMNAREAAGAFFPGVASEVTYANSTLGRVTPQTIDKSFSAGISGEMTLFDGLRTMTAFKRARRSLDAAFNAKNYTKQEILYTAVYRFFKACLDSTVVSIEEKNVQYQQALLAKIEALKNAGEKPLGEYLTQKVYVAQAERSLSVSRNNFVLSKHNLARLLGNDSLLSGASLTMLSADTGNLLDKLRSDTLISAARSKRPDLMQRRDNIEIARYDMLLAKSSLYPVLTLGGSISGKHYYPVDLPFDEQFIDKNFQRNVSLTLSFPIFDRLSVKYDLSRSKVRYNQALAERDELTKQIAIDIEESHRVLLSSLDQNHLSHSEFTLSQQALKAAQSRYDAGALTLSELYSINSLVIQAEQQMASSWYTILMSIVNLGFHSGDIESVISLLLENN